MAVDYSLLDDYLRNVKSKLRKYQELGIGKCITHRRVVIDLRMGRGKTLIALTGTLYHKPKRVLILCTRNAYYTWQKELEKWYPAYASDYTIVRGTPAQRKRLWAADTLFKVTTPASFMRDWKIIPHMFDGLIIDEYHKSGLKNRKSEFFEILGHVLREKLNPNFTFFPMSGTPVSRGPQEMWGPLHYCDPKLFKSYWRFVTAFCIVEDNGFGKEIKGPQNTEGLKQIIANNWYRVRDEEAELPKLVRMPLYTELPPDLQRVYDTFVNDMIIELDGKLFTATNGMAIFTQVRKFLCSPKLISPSLPVGPAIETVIEKIQEGSPEDQHCVIFVPFRSAVQIVVDALHKAKFNNVYTLMGGAEPEEIKRVTTNFRKQPDSIAVCTIKFAQSFEFESSNICYFIGGELDQNDNEQAEGRLRRMSSDHSTVFAYYVLHKGIPHDEQVVDLWNNKAHNVKITFQNIDQLKKLVAHKNPS